MNTSTAELELELPALDVLEVRLERRRSPRNVGVPGYCHHCEHTRPAAHHFRDAGNIELERAVELGYCPVLLVKRSGR